MTNREIEVKFLEIDKPKLVDLLIKLGAQDLGEEKIKEQIFYDKDLTWPTAHKFARIRTTGKGIFFTYKHATERTALGTEEIEFSISDSERMKDFLEILDLRMFREQEKMRHKFKLSDVIVDIDTWPKVLTYVELEGPSEGAIKAAAEKLGFDWSKGVFGNAAMVLEEVYQIPVRKLRYFTFDRVE